MHHNSAHKVHSIEEDVAQLRKVGKNQPDCLQITYAEWKQMANGSSRYRIKLTFHVYSLFISTTSPDIPQASLGQSILYLTLPNDYESAQTPEISIKMDKLILFHPCIPENGSFSVPGDLISVVGQLWNYYIFTPESLQNSNALNDAASNWLRNNGLSHDITSQHSLQLEEIISKKEVQKKQRSPTRSTSPESYATQPEQFSPSHSSSPNITDKLVLSAKQQRPVNTGFRPKTTREYVPLNAPFPQISAGRQNQNYFQDWTYSFSASSRKRDPLKIVIIASALQKILQHARADLRNERFGILIGGVFHDEEMHEDWVEIVDMHPAERVQANIASVEVSHEELSRMNAEVDQIYQQTPTTIRKIGWYHTHPGHGIFLSTTDQTNQRLAYNASWQIALVVDPIHHCYGAFAGAQCVPILDSFFVLSEEKARSLRTLSFQGWEAIHYNPAAFKAIAAPSSAVEHPQPTPYLDRQELQDSAQTGSDKDTDDAEHSPRDNKPALIPRATMTGRIYRFANTPVRIKTYILGLTSLLLLLAIIASASFMYTQYQTNRQQNNLDHLHQIQAQHTLTQSQAQTTRAQNTLQDTQHTLYQQSDALKDIDTVSYYKLLVIAYKINPDSNTGQILANQLNHFTYTVSQKDIAKGLTGIADMFGVSLSALQKANPALKNQPLALLQKIAFTNVLPSSKIA